MGITGYWMLRIALARGSAHDVRITDVLMAIAGFSHCVTGGLMLLYTTAVWKGSRVERLLVGMVDAVCEHNGDDRRH